MDRQSRPTLSMGCAGFWTLNRAVGTAFFNVSLGTTIDAQIDGMGFAAQE